MKNIFSKLLLIILFFNLLSCSKDDDTTPNNNGGGNTQSGITVTTIDATNIKTIIATINCKVVVDPALNTISMKGVVWSTSPNPITPLTTKTSDGNSTGNYQSFITNLVSNTKYYIRGYAIDSNGNSVYGNEISFTTKVGWKIIESGYFYSLGIKLDGTLWGWGDNRNGQLGNGTSINQNSPVQIGTNQDWKSISTGGVSPGSSSDGFYTLAIKNDGTLWSWGKNADGRLGDGTNIDKFIPTKISNDSWSQVSAGINFSIGIKTDGTVWAWGQVWRLNDYYNSTGLYTNVKTPMQLSSINNCKSVFCGLGYAIFLKNNGTIWGWGKNSYDALGFGATTTNTYQTLQQIGTNNNWLDIFCRNGTSIITKSDGTVSGWGIGNGGQFGDGTNSNKSIPTQISSNLGTNALIISHSKSAMTYYIKQDGTLWATGSGILGDGTPFGYSRFVFAQVGTKNIWKYVNIGTTCNFAIQTNGSLWVCGGNNNYGQLGIGDNNSSTQKLSFTLVD